MCLSRLVALLSMTFFPRRCLMTEWRKASNTRHSIYILLLFSSFPTSLEVFPYDCKAGWVWR